MARADEPAFPALYDSLGHRGAANGLTIREWLAGQAMKALAHDILIEQHWEDVLKKNGLAIEEFPAYLAHLCCVTADAMLAEFEKK